MKIQPIYIIAVCLALIIFIMLYKDERVGAKYLGTVKKFIMILLVAAIAYIYDPRIGLIIGFTSGYTGVTNFDKDFNGRFILESVKIIVMQMLVGVAAYLCSFNEILTIVASATVIFAMYYFFTHKSKMARGRGFLLTYIILLDQKVPRADFKGVFGCLLIGIVLSIAFYYFFTRDTYYKESRILEFKTLAQSFKPSNFFVEEDRDEDFKRKKLRHAIISTILMTCAVYYMIYFGNPESMWIIIVASAILVIDPVTSEKMIIDRTLGTIIGAIIFLVIHKFIPSVELTNIFIFIAIFYLMFPMAYYKRMVFITYFVLEIHSRLSSYSPDYLVGYRIGFTIIAAIIVLIIIAIESRIALRKEKS
ncbi:MAG: FUSC family protein [Clostridium sp.]|uniref:FUSC family protein n=1 Tax=Clostridium sp. TaxID=1506 RepID=UPI003EE7B873